MFLLEQQVNYSSGPQGYLTSSLQLLNFQNFLLNDSTESKVATVILGGKVSFGLSACVLGLGSRGIYIQLGSITDPTS